MRLPFKMQESASSLNNKENYETASFCFKLSAWSENYSQGSKDLEYCILKHYNLIGHPRRN
jgi:hypothetical protein